MAHHKSALKRMRQNERRRQHNRQIKSAARTLIRKVREAVEGGDGTQAEKDLRAVVGGLSRAASKGVIPKARASRRISRLSRLVHSMG